MADIREPILARIFTVLEGITYPSTTMKVRNRGDVPEKEFPAIVFLDGVEGRTRPLAEGRGRVVSPCLVELRPQIFYLAKRRDRPKEQIDLGPELSAVRALIIKAIFTDEELVRLVGGPRGNGEINYLGSDTDMQSGSTLEGTLRIDMAFVYPLIPSAL